MNRDELYTWQGEVMKIFACLGKWQALSSAIFSDGVMVVGSTESVKRRLKRFLDNERIVVRQCRQVKIDVVICNPGKSGTSDSRAMPVGGRFQEKGFSHHFCMASISLGSRFIKPAEDPEYLNLKYP